MYIIRILYLVERPKSSLLNSLNPQWSHLMLVAIVFHSLALFTWKYQGVPQTCIYSSSATLCNRNPISPFFREIWRPTWPGGCLNSVDPSWHSSIRTTAFEPAELKVAQTGESNSVGKLLTVIVREAPPTSTP